MHVLPRGFVKIRHYGLSASVHVQTKLAKAQSVLGPPGMEHDGQAPQDKLQERSGGDDHDLLRLLVIAAFILGSAPCPNCEYGRLRLQVRATGPPA